jgi:glycosyltransferase involved in cell wall biosynthesis
MGIIPTRVAIVAHYAPSVALFRGALIRALVQRGVQVWVLAPDFTPATRDQVAMLGGQPADYFLNRTGANPFHDIRSVVSLRSCLRHCQPQAVLAYGIKPVVYGILAAQSLNIPRRIALITRLGYAFTHPAGVKGASIHLAARLLYRVALQASHTVLFQNTDDLYEFTETSIVSPQKALVVGGTGVDLEEFAAHPPTLEPITFTLAARLLREKGIVEFAQAAQRIKQHYPNTRFLLLGGLDTNPGALREHEVRQWAEAGILEWHGHVPDVRPYFAQTSVYVLPSYREGVPRSTQEAMAMARPVITTDAPGCRETVIDGVNGFLVPPRDVDALVRAMERFILQPELIITMGQASRKLAEERFDVHKINQRILAVLGITGDNAEASGETSNGALHSSSRDCSVSHKIVSGCSVQGLRSGQALPRIVIIAPYAPSIVSFRGVLIRALVEHGATVWVLAPDYTSAIKEAVHALGAHPIDYPMHRTGTNPLADWRTFWALRHILRQIQPHVLLPYNIKPILYGLLAGGRVERRVALIEGLGYAFTQTEPSVRQRILRYLVRQMYRIALKRAHAVLFLNPDDQREFCRLSLVSAEQAVLLGGIGVDLSEYMPAPAVLEPITFTLAARLLREKGIVEFAQAAQRIKQHYPNTRFLLLGGLDTNPGALREHEVRQWAEAGILEWHGHVPDVRPYFAQTSVYVLPSYREGVPRSTQEAMAMARPVITTDAPGCRETVIDGVNGFLVPPRDVDALVRAMERFILQPELIITMGQASRKLAEERFDVHKINQRILAVMGIAGSGTEFPKIADDAKTSSSTPQAGV